MDKGNVKLRIYGMTCDDCVRSISDGLKKQPGVIDVKISLKEGCGEVKIDPAELKPLELLKNQVFSKNSHYKAILIE
ncbi:copper chaperone [mine drainage metagenome]|uniref:Copper chaperone n=1 Tax=mine drainage metagenome TaxID=410659 RepID=T1A7H2_9ZZZZ